VRLLTCEVFCFLDRVFLSSIVTRANQLEIEDWNELCSATFLKPRSSAEKTGVTSAIVVRKPNRGQCKAGSINEFIIEYGKVWKDTMTQPEPSNPTNLKRLFKNLFAFSVSKGYLFKGVILGLLHALHSTFSVYEISKT